MSIRKKNTDINPRQISLFDFVKQHHEESRKYESQAGTLNVTLQLQETINKCIGKSPYSRDIIAGKMSELTGQTITRAMIDAWTSSAKHHHRFPAEFLPALCVAVESHEPINLLARKSGIFTLPDKDVLMADLAHKIQKREETNREIKKIKTYLQEMDSKAHARN